MFACEQNLTHPSRSEQIQPPPPPRLPGLKQIHNLPPIFPPQQSATYYFQLITGVLRLNAVFKLNVHFQSLDPIFELKFDFKVLDQLSNVLNEGQFSSLNPISR